MRFVEEGLESARVLIPLRARAGIKLRASDGFEELGHPEMMSTPLFYLAHAGDRLRLLDDAYRFNVATYAPEIDPRWIYTYMYAPDQSWTRYRRDLCVDTYRQKDYIFNERLYFRVCLRKKDGSLFDPSTDINDMMAFETVARTPEPVKPWLVQEALRVASRINALRSPGDMVFALLTDSHYNVNGTWADTAASIGLVREAAGFDGIIHLGDFTDGMVTADAARHYVSRVLDDLRSNGVPVWAALGNHDSNYFKGNPERFTLQEQRELYVEGRELHYAVDFPGQGLRYLFLDSFDPGEDLRYGYTQSCIAWLSNQLNGLPEGTRAVIFSHLPPVARLQYWAKALRGETELLRVIRPYRERILAWINGHNHADRLDEVEGMCVVSIGNAKCEAYREHKTEHYITPDRRLDSANQELWDVLLITPCRGVVRFIRFGAGRDRIITDGNAAWL